MTKFSQCFCLNLTNSFTRDSKDLSDFFKRARTAIVKPKAEQNKILMGHLFALVTILLWGTTFISTKVLLRSFTPIDILFFRFIMGLIVLFLIYPHRLRVTDKKQEWIFAGAGLSGITLYYLFENIALVYAPASNVGVITATAPFFTALLACRFLAGEALQKKFILGFVLAIAGIAMISFNSATQLH